MSRIQANSPVAALLATVALLGLGCAAKEPVETEEETGEANAAVLGDVPFEPGGEGLAESADPVDPAAAPEPIAAPAPKLCGSIWSELPAGTQTWKQPDGSVGYALPPGFVSVEVDPGTGTSSLVSGGSLTCTCQSGEGTCESQIRSGFVGCFVGAECSQCVTGGASAVLDLNVGVTFAAAEDVSTLPPVTPALLGLPIVADALQQFEVTVAAGAGLGSEQELQGPATGDLAGAHAFVSAPGWTLAAVNVFGHVALVSVPESHAQQAAIAWGSTQKCSCGAGSGCKVGSMLGARYCDAGDCTSCSLTLSAAAAGDVALVSVNETMACGM